ncbi:aminotransferase class I/II-fold pyridoxal phosphate-dependent enzyme [bacterium]|nr:aminotransferase class I/II-fold pyridoxal phosphate-dependent enzyme [bacterium]
MRKFEVTAFEPMKAVYSYLFSDTRDVLKRVGPFIHPDLFRVTTEASRAGQILSNLVTPALEVTATGEGKLDLDMIHQPIIERVVDAYAHRVLGLKHFAFRYPGQGSSEGIFHLLVRLRTQGVTTIHVLRGEYEGYGAQAKNLGMRVVEHDLEAVHELIEPGYWFISNPSASNGNLLPEQFLRSLLDAGHRVIFDLAYVGLTREYVFDMSHPNIVAVVISFSKPYGVFRLRLGGFIFTREELPTFYGSKWFKDCERLLQALVLAESIGPDYLYPRYKPVQDAIIAALNARYQLGLVASDVLLLALLGKREAERLSSDQRAMIEPYKRGDYYRFCLTPYFEQAEAQGFCPEFYARTQGGNLVVQSIDNGADKFKEEDFPLRVWLRQHYDELPVNEWVAVNSDGLVAHDADLLKLVDKVIALGLRGVELTYTFTAPTGLKVTWSIAAQ